MSAICPNGHASESTDYCDVCGEPMGAASSSASGAVSSGSAGAGAPVAGEGTAGGGEPITCPHCSFPAAAGALWPACMLVGVMGSSAHRRRRMPGLG